MPNPGRFVSSARIELKAGPQDPPIELLQAEIVEGLNELYTISADVILRDHAWDVTDALGTEGSIVSAMQDSGDTLREFNGIITDIEFLYYAKRYAAYRLTLRPRLYLFAHNREHRIFQDKTTQAIVDGILAERKIDATFSLQGSYKPRPYTVQYGESDFAFISRLIEEEGIAYVFVHKDGKHGLEFTDVVTSRPAERVETLKFRSFIHGNYADYFDADGATAIVMDWHELVRSRGEGKVSLSDYNYEKPDLSQLKSEAFSVPAAGEIYDYPAVTSHNDFDAIGSRTKTRLQAIQASRAVYTAHAQSSALTVGSKVTVAEHPFDRYNVDYTISRLKTVVVGDVFEEDSDGNPVEKAIAGGWFTAFPSRIKWAPPQITPRPVARGPETAIVTGPANETIHTDEYGRVKVQFHWDRLGKKDEKTTCWIRVSQTGGLGNVILPRVGHEVIVDFIDGNPDRPLVVGRVFNATDMPHYKLDMHKTRAVWRSKPYPKDDGTLDTGAVDFAEFKKIYDGYKAPPPGNELRFEDQSGKEHVLINAHRDMYTRARNKHFLFVGQDQSMAVGQDETRNVGRDFKEKIVRDVTIEIGGKEDLTTTGDRTETLKAKHTITTTGDRTETLKAKHTITTTGETTHDTEAAFSVTVKSGDYTLKTSSGSITAKAGQKITLKAPAGISIECGSSKITMTPASIKIEAATIEIAGQATTKVSASGIVEVQGGLIKLN